MEKGTDPNDDQADKASSRAVRTALESAGMQCLEQLYPHITRPALTNERVKTNTVGQVVLKLKTPWRDGTTHLVMSPPALIQRLAAMVLRPRLHQPLTASRLSISAVGSPVRVVTGCSTPQIYGGRTAVIEQ